MIASLYQWSVLTILNSRFPPEPAFLHFGFRTHFAFLLRGCRQRPRSLTSRAGTVSKAVEANVDSGAHEHPPNTRDYTNAVESIKESTNVDHSGQSSYVLKSPMHLVKQGTGLRQESKPNTWRREFDRLNPRRRRKQELDREYSLVAGEQHLNRSLEGTFGR